MFMPNFTVEREGDYGFRDVAKWAQNFRVSESQDWPPFFQPSFTSETLC